MLSLRRFQTFLQCSQQALKSLLYIHISIAQWLISRYTFYCFAFSESPKKKIEKKKKNLFFSPQSPKSWSASTFSLASNASLLCSFFLIFMLDNTWLARSENAWWKKKESLNWMFLLILKTPHSQLKPGNKHSGRKCPAITNNSPKVATILQPLLTLSGTHILPFNCNWNVARPWKVWVRD